MNLKVIKTQDTIYDKMTFNGYKIHRLKKIVNHIPNNSGIEFLDVACGAGQFYDILKELKPNVKYYGLEFSSKQVSIAKKKGYNVKKHDLTKKWPYEDNTFDVLLASEIIEHIFDTDYFASECYRVLKKNGILILTTPNIASLGDRFRLLFGKLPSAIENRARGENISGHIRAFTYNDILNILKENNFKNIKITGREFYLPLISPEMKYFGKINFLLSEIFPNLSAGFIVIARKR